MAFPTGARECQCGACHRGFTGLEAFDAHRQGHRCLEPSSVGLWLATDGLWSTSPRNARLEADDRKRRGLALARLHRDTKTR